MRLYCHNVLSPRPTEFVSLDALNFSFFPAGGAAQGSDLSTTFTKLRVSGIIELAHSSLVIVREPALLEQLAAGELQGFK